MFNYFTTKIKAFDVEMDNSSSELVDYFLKRGIVTRQLNYRRTAMLVDGLLLFSADYCSTEDFPA
jgi:hypothetical protein